MKRRSRRKSFLLAILVGLGFVLGSCQSQRGVMLKRRHDVEALTALCLQHTNIFTTDEMMHLAQQSKVRLFSPIPIDPAKPCYQLVTPPGSQGNVLRPETILVEEVNVTDAMQAFVSFADGSTQLISRNRLQPRQ